MPSDETNVKLRVWAVPQSFETTGGRARGQQLRGEILAQLQEVAPDGVLLIDFSTVQTLDFSAADEVVGGLVGRVIAGELGTRRFVLTGLSDAVRESIDAVLQLRKRQCLELQADGRGRAIGPISPAHEETLQFVMERGEVAVVDVATRFWAEPRMTAATNRLNTLADSGLVVRRVERGGPRGNRYVYRAIVSRKSRGASPES